MEQRLILFSAESFNPKGIEDVSGTPNTSEQLTELQQSLTAEQQKEAIALQSAQSRNALRETIEIAQPSLVEKAKEDVQVMEGRVGDIDNLALSEEGQNKAAQDFITNYFASIPPAASADTIVNTPDGKSTTLGAIVDALAYARDQLRNGAITQDVMAELEQSLG